MYNKEKEMTQVNKKVRDMFGNIITPGDYIVYPCRQGSDTYMRTAKVQDVTTRDLEEEGSETVLKATTCIPPRYIERKANPNWRKEVLLRKTTISQFCRATIVPKAYIQNDSRYKQLLEA
jgi:hypothetical protein